MYMPPLCDWRCIAQRWKSRWSRRYEASVLNNVMTFIRVFIISYIAARILCVCLCVVLRPTSGINSTLSVILCVLQYNTTFGFVLVIVRRRLRIAANVYIIFSQSHRHRLAGWSLGSVVPTVMIDQMEMQCDSSLLRCEFWLWNFLAKLTVKHRLVGNGICERTFRDHWRQESDIAIILIASCLAQ